MVGGQGGDGPIPLPRDETLIRHTLDAYHIHADAADQYSDIDEKPDDEKKVAAKATSEEVDASELLLSFAGRPSKSGSDASPLPSPPESVDTSNVSHFNDDTTRNSVVIANGTTAATTTTTTTAESEHTTKTAVDKWFGHALEYAAGVALRSHVLEPMLQSMAGLPLEFFSSKLRSCAHAFLGSYSRGTGLLMKNTVSKGIQEASVSRVDHGDSSTLASWWEHDKVLSYASAEWSDWWAKRCLIMDPGCEMVKLSINDKILGVAYYERNLVDVYDHEKEKSGRVRVTLIRGIRLAPHINPEAIQRSDDRIFKNWGQSPTVEFEDVASLLLTHILFTSLRYGTKCVGVHCQKNEFAETFYESFMGKPFARHDGDGRLYYRIDPKLRWEVLQNSFRRQMLLRAEQLAQQPQTETEAFKNAQHLDNEQKKYFTKDARGFTK